MTDYWVSTKKHYCEVCKIWMSGHPYNVKIHETTPKHLTAMRNAIIDSHKREKDRKKAEEFEREELERIEKLANEESTASSLPIIDEPPPSTYMPNRIISRLPTKQEEMNRLEEFYSKLLNNQAEMDNLPSNAPTAHVDPEMEKKLEKFLGTDWIKKLDPIRKIKYFHNQKTRQIKLINQDLISAYQRTVAPAESANVSTSTILSNNTAKNEVTATQKPAIAINIKSKPQTTENEEDKEQPSIESTAPVIGEWEVVNPEESVFNLPVYTEDTDKHQSGSEESTYSDYMEVSAKPKFAKPIANKSVSFTRRDVSVIKRQKKLDNNLNMQIKQEQAV